MIKEISIYLAGSIKKDHESYEGFFWGEDERIALSNALSPYQTLFLNPAFRTDDLTDQLSVFGRDMFQVYSSHFVFVDARARRGLGVGAEMMWAKVNKIPLVVWAPSDSHYNKVKASVLDIEVTNYVHPFVESLSDYIATSLEDAAEFAKLYSENPSQYSIKGIEQMHQAMNHYKNKQFQYDTPMKELVEASERLQQKMKEINI